MDHRIPTLIMLVGVILILLAACANAFAPYWRKSLPALRYDGITNHPTRYDLERACAQVRDNRLGAGQSIKACTVRNERAGSYRIHAGPEFDACAWRHEHAHGAGWMHDARMPFDWDCGPADFTPSIGLR